MTSDTKDKKSFKICPYSYYSDGRFQCRVSGDSCVYLIPTPNCEYVDFEGSEVEE